MRTAGSPHSRARSAERGCQTGKEDAEIASQKTRSTRVSPFRRAVTPRAPLRGKGTRASQPPARRIRVSVSKSLKSSLIGLFLYPSRHRHRRKSSRVGSADRRASASGPGAAGSPTGRLSSATFLPPPAAAPVATPAPQPAVVLTGIPKEQAQLLAQSGFVDAGPGGFGVRSASKESQLRFHLQVQADAKFWHGTTRPRSTKPSFCAGRSPGLMEPCPTASAFSSPRISARSTAPTPRPRRTPPSFSPTPISRSRFWTSCSSASENSALPSGSNGCSRPASVLQRIRAGHRTHAFAGLGRSGTGRDRKGYAGYALGVFNGAVDNAYTDLDPSRYKDLKVASSRNPRCPQPGFLSVRHHRNRRNRRSQERSAAGCRPVPEFADLQIPRGRCDLFVQDRQHAWLADTAIASDSSEGSTPTATILWVLSACSRSTSTRSSGWASTMTTLAWATKGGPPKRRYSCTAATRLTRKPRSRRPLTCKLAPSAPSSWSRGPRS